MVAPSTTQTGNLTPPNPPSTTSTPTSSNDKVVVTSDNFGNPIIVSGQTQTISQVLSSRSAGGGGSSSSTSTPSIGELAASGQLQEEIQSRTAAKAAAAAKQKTEEQAQQKRQQETKEQEALILMAAEQQVKASSKFGGLRARRLAETKQQIAEPTTTTANIAGGKTTITGEVRPFSYTQGSRIRQTLTKQGFDVKQTEQGIKAIKEGKTVLIDRPADQSFRVAGRAETTTAKIDPAFFSNIQSKKVNTFTNTFLEKPFKIVSENAGELVAKAKKNITIPAVIGIAAPIARETTKRIKKTVSVVSKSIQTASKESGLTALMGEKVDIPNVPIFHFTRGRPKDTDFTLTKKKPQSNEKQTFLNVLDVTIEPIDTAIDIQKRNIKQSFKINRNIQSLPQDVRQKAIIIKAGLGVTKTAATSGLSFAQSGVRAIRYKTPQIAAGIGIAAVLAPAAGLVYSAKFVGASVKGLTIGAYSVYSSFRIITQPTADAQAGKLGDILFLEVVPFTIGANVARITVKDIGKNILRADIREQLAQEQGLKSLRIGQEQNRLRTSSGGGESPPKLKSTSLESDGLGGSKGFRAQDQVSTGGRPNEVFQGKNLDNLGGMKGLGKERSAFGNLGGGKQKLLLIEETEVIRGMEVVTTKLETPSLKSITLAFPKVSTIQRLGSILAITSQGNFVPLLSVTPNTKSKLTIKTSQQQRQIQQSKTQLKIETKTKQLTESTAIQKTMTEQKSTQRGITSQVTAPAVRTEVKQKQKTDVVTISKPQLDLDLKQETPKKPPKTNPVPRLEFKLTKTSNIERPQDGYDVLVRHRGKFIRANKKPLPENKAKNLGAKVVDNTTSATFKIKKSDKKTNQRDDLKFNLLNKFRKKGNKYIEKNKHRIDSVGELNGITAKGWLARRKNRF